MQISQAYDTGEDGPGIIVRCVPQGAAESDIASLEPVFEQQKLMGTLPEKLLADTAYGSQAHVEMSAGIGIQLVSPAGGTAEKTDAEIRRVAAGTQTEGNPLAGQEAKKAALNQRRAEQETPEWKQEYAKRGIRQKLSAGQVRLLEFHRAHGHFQIPKVQDPALAAWASGQRRNREDLSAEKRGLLEKIAFPWDPQADEEEERFEQLEAFKRKYYHRLSTERQRRLQELGFSHESRVGRPPAALALAAIAQVFTSQARTAVSSKSRGKSPSSSRSIPT
ncbi:MAG: Helicase associated domain protein [Terrimicrobiaceae bacterium]|nr:Helicase associated domain protein [Terrimicrobiaceae bacterium]